MANQNTAGGGTSLLSFASLLFTLKTKCVDLRLVSEKVLVLSLNLIEKRFLKRSVLVKLVKYHN